MPSGIVKQAAGNWQHGTNKFDRIHPERSFGNRTGPSTSPTPPHTTPQPPKPGHIGEAAHVVAHRGGRVHAVRGPQNVQEARQPVLLDNAESCFPMRQNILPKLGPIIKPSRKPLSQCAPEPNPPPPHPGPPALAWLTCCLPACLPACLLACLRPPTLQTA